MRKSHEILIVATDADWWKLNVAKNIAPQPNNISDASYVAFYRTEPISAITHMAKVDRIDRDVLNSRTYIGFPKIKAKLVERGHWGKLHTVFRLKKMKRLRRLIAKEPERGGIRLNKFTTMRELKSATCLTDLFQRRERK